MTRRVLLKLTLGAFGAYLLPIRMAFSARGKKIIPETDISVTSNRDFYVQSVGDSPRIKERDWQLIMEGMVSKPRAWSYSALKSRPSKEYMVTLACIGNQPGGEQIGNAVWKGFLLEDLLAEVMLDPGANRLIFECADIFTSSSSVDQLFGSGSILAYEMNGRKLGRDHGFPLRLIQPGCYGMKSPKWIRKIIATADEHKGYWENFGWSDRGFIQLTTRIDDHISNHTLRGVALNGQKAIERVEVSLDDGLTWQEADLEQTERSVVWSQWSLDLGDRKGDLTVVCRAINQDGETQNPHDSNPFPDGASAPDRQRFRLL